MTATQSLPDSLVSNSALTGKKQDSRWKKGQSGNPKGRPPGKTLKEYTRERLATMTDEERIKFLNSIPAELAWRMSEGNPPQTLEGNPDKPLIIQVPVVVSKRFKINGADTKTGDSDSE